jgi:hypothetical protein
MDCLACTDLKQRYEASLADFTEARSSAYYRVTHRFAAAKNVEMERARFELEEHRSVCVPPRDVIVQLPKGVLPFRERRLVA